MNNGKTVFAQLMSVNAEYMWGCFSAGFGPGIQKLRGCGWGADRFARTPQLGPEDEATLREQMN